MMFIEHWIAEQAMTFQLIVHFVFSQGTPRQMEGIYQSIPNNTKI